MTLRSALVVEDEFLIAEEMKAFLEEHGWRVIGPAYRSSQALDLIAAEAPTITVLDLVLGDQVATELAQTLRRMQVPTILVTGWDVIDGPLAELPIIRKPIDFPTLLSTANALAPAPPRPTIRRITGRPSEG